MKNIDDEKQYIYSRDNYCCQVCGNPNQSELTIAHRIRQGRNSTDMIKKWLTKREIKCNVETILHDPANLVLTCARCNSKVDISFNPVEVDRILRTITEAMK